MSAFDTITDTITDTAAATAIARNAFLDLPLACSAEGVRFMGDRLQAQSSHGAALLHCRSGEELVTEQVRFLLATGYAYGQEANRLIRMTQGAFTTLSAAG